MCVKGLRRHKILFRRETIATAQPASIILDSQLHSQPGPRADSQPNSQPEPQPAESQGDACHHDGESPAGDQEDTPDLGGLWEPHTPLAF